jgi:hypothetical protein
LVDWENIVERRWRRADWKLSASCATSQTGLPVDTRSGKLFARRNGEFIGARGLVPAGRVVPIN